MPKLITPCHENSIIREGHRPFRRTLKEAAVQHVKHSKSVQAV